MLAMAVLVLQSVVTSLVYAAEPEQTNPEVSVSEAVVETTTDEIDADESSNEEVTTDSTDTEIPTVEEQVIIEPEVLVAEEPTIANEEPKVDLEEEVDFYLPRFNLFKTTASPVLIRALNTENPRWECEWENDDSVCIKNPVNTAGSLDNEWDVQITKVVETTDIEWEYKITVEVKWNPVETVEATPNNICSIVVFDRSGSMWDEEDVCVETYSEWECMERFLRWCTRYAEGWECKRYESQSKKWNDAVNWAKVFASTLNELNNDWNVAKIWLVTFAKDVHIGRTPDFSDLSDWNFGKANGWTNLDAWLLRAQELLDADEFCNTWNAKKYIVAITDWAPTFAWVSGNIWDGYNSSIPTVTPQTTADAEAIKESWIEIFTIWYQLEEINGFDTADYLKNNIASNPSYAYEWEDADKVAEAFQKISETIKEHAAWTEANLEDKIWWNVTIVASEENLEPNKLENFTITEDSQIIEFYVKIKDWADNGDYDTNAWVILTYTWYDPETWDPIPWQELSIETSSQVHWVQPWCEWTEPTIVEWVTKMWASTYPRKWNAAWDALEPVGYSEWTYVDAKPDLAACEWTCDGEWYEYDAENNTCKLGKHTVVVDPKCVEWESCEGIEEDVDHGSKYTLPKLERKYTLTYQENENVQDKVNPNPVTVEAILLGYCENAETCESPIAPETEVVITENVTYNAVWNETPLTVNLTDWNWYTTPEYNYNFKEWQNEWKAVSESIMLIKDETLVAQYDTEPREYTVTYKVDWEIYGDIDTVAYGTELTPREKPSKIWYAFRGWSEIPATMPAENLVIEWSFIPNTYTVKFDANGGEWEMENQSFTYDVEQALAINTFTKDWYKFNWWKAWEDSYSDWQVVSNLTAENWVTITLTAQWIANSDIAYTVEYYMQNVEDSDYTLDEERTENKVWTTDAEVSVTPEEINGFTLNNEKSTLAWIISADGELVLKVYYDRIESSIIIDPNCEDENEVCNIITETWSYEKEVTLPEKIRSYTLSYKVPEWALEVDPQTVIATVIWYCKGNSANCEESERIPVGTAVKIEAESVTYTAVWSNDMTATVADGSNYQTDTTVYTFNTWKDGDNDVAPQSRLTLTADKELVANYTESVRNYMITFVNEDGTVLQSGNVAYGEMPEYTWETPTKEGSIEYAYTFDNWTPELTWVTESAVYTATYRESCNTWYHYETTPNGTTSDKICVNNEKKEWVVCTQEWAPSNAHYNVTTWAWTWNGTTYVWVKCGWDCNPWYTRDGNSCNKSSWWWGWWSTHYSCRWEVPANAVANNDLEPSNSSTNYSYSSNKGDACTFQCKSGYTRKDNKCVEQGWSNGWWDEEIELGWQVSDKCSVEWSNRSDEEKEAYLYACENDITTIRDIEKARLGDFLTRAEMAKMISVFATKELWMKPNTSKDCSNFANSIANYNQEMKDYMVMACQLEIMWIHTTNYEAIPDFMPNKHVSRAEFWTVLSRILWWNKYEGTNSNYYVNHLNALKENSIITNIDPTITEYRAWVFLMLYRSVEAIKIAKAASNETVEEQVNEELQSETWNDTEVATWTSTEVETWSTIEAQTGDMATTTDIAKDEAEVETGSTVETWSTND